MQLNLRYVHLIVCAILICSSLSAQNQKIDLVGENSAFQLQDLFRQLEDQSGLFFSYNANQLPLSDTIVLSLSQNISLGEILLEIQNQFLLEFIFNEVGDKIIVSPPKEREIVGRIVDALSQECIIGATIVSSTQVSSISNVNGYFRIIVPYSDTIITIQNMGYHKKQISLLKTVDNIEIKLESNNDLNIVITPEPRLKVKQDKKIVVDEIDNNVSLGGTPDVFSYLKNQPGVSSGSEGQNGILVRGGGPHQNLLLIDGMPVYEGSHLGGLSSIFLPNAINNLTFYKSAFPARFGGKLSGVIDVNLKEGSKHSYNRKLTVGIEGLTAHIDGPLGPKTTINLNGKLSWFGNLISPFIKHNSSIQNLELKYNDTYLKATHNFSNKDKLSLSAYFGEDLVLLQRFGNNENVFQDYNRINWGNRLISLNWSSVFSKKVSFSTHVGLTNYNYRSRGTYDLKYINDQEEEQRQFDILSVSTIGDLIVNPQIEIFNDNSSKIIFGINYTKHQNEPSIIESEKYNPNNEIPSTIDTIYLTDEVAAYLEYNFQLSSKVFVNSGVRANGYFNNDISYFYLQPRMSFEIKNNNDFIQFSYSRMSQFTHLLTNPGLGIPSDLWVPTTDLVPPELSDNFSFDYKYYKQNFNYGFSVFYKRYENLIEYSNPADILYSFIINDELFQIEVDNNNWEQRVSLGTGKSYGLELFGAFHWNSLQLNGAYTVSKSVREFESIDDGEAFPYKFDRPHDVKLGLTYTLSENKNIRINWTYGTGNAYTLSNEVQIGADDNPVLVPSSRNNTRLQDFHHLDIGYEVIKKLKNNGNVKLNIGLYNVYNRLNPFYEYLSENTLDQSPELVKVSLFPILPQFNMTWSW